MKRIMLVMIAAVMAVGLSAFTPPEPPVTVYFQDGGTGPWLSANLTPCQAGSVQQCIVTTPSHGDEQIFDAPNGNPYTSKP